MYPLAPCFPHLSTCPQMPGPVTLPFFILYRSDSPSHPEGTVLFLPQLENVFALPIIKGDTALGPGQADRHFSVVWHSRAGCLHVLVETKAPVPQDTVHILP